MKLLQVTPVSSLSGSVSVPGDKSISHRAAMLAGIATGTSRITGFLAGSDCLATLRAMQSLGVNVDEDEAGALTVTGRTLTGLKAPADTLDLGNSGTGMRLLAGILAGQRFDSILTGDESLMTRPMERIAAPLRQMGGRVQTTDGRPPVHIFGGTQLKAIEYAMPVASAQVKSALLLAGLYADGDTQIREPAVTRDHTERMMAAFGVPVERFGKRISLHGPSQPLATDIHVPGDFSSAAFPLLGGCLAGDGEVHLKDIGVNPTRTGFIDILTRMGGDISVRINDQAAEGEPTGDISVRPSALEGIEVPPELVSLAIDEFPLVFAAAARAHGVTRITGAAELRAKESDRIATMVAGLNALGVDARELEDGALIKGGRIRGGRVESHGDHRIAMAFATLATIADGPVEIRDVENVGTSFPGFVDLMNGLGAEITEVEAA
jgi:3-phosphoshikimate 1-carboxyvinyltransferase